MARALADPVKWASCRHKAGQAETDRVDPAAHIEAVDIGEPLVEWRHRVPEIRLGATDAGMPAADRPVGAFVPLDDRTVLRSRRPLASHLVKAVALAMCFVAPGLYVLSGVEMCAPFAIVVDGLAVGEEWTSILIEWRPPLQGHVVDNKRGKV